MTLSFAQKCLYPYQGLFVRLLSPTSKGFLVELKVGRKTKAYLSQIFCKVKNRTQRVSKSYNHDREVHVCGYVVDGVESKRIRCSMICLSLLMFLAWLIFLFLHGRSCVHFFFMDLHVSIFFHGPSCAPFFFNT